jgi:voltage-gated potassium channel
MLASLIMILGYGMIAVPTGIVTVEMAAASRSQAASRSKAGPRTCGGCGQRRHDSDAGFCKSCGRELEPVEGS